MPKYEVIRPWWGKKKGDIVTLAKVHPSLQSNVRLLQGEIGAAADLVSDSEPSKTADIDRTDKKAVVAELKRRSIPFDGRAGLDELVALLDQ